MPVDGPGITWWFMPDGYWRRDTWIGPYETFAKMKRAHPDARWPT